MIIFSFATIIALLIAAGVGLMLPPLDFASGARLLLFHAVFVYGAVVFRFGGAMTFAALSGVIWDLVNLPILDDPQSTELLRPGWSVIFFGCMAAVVNGLRVHVLIEGRWDLHALATGAVILFHFTAEFLYITLLRSSSTPPELSFTVASKIGATALFALLTAPLVYFSLSGVESLCGSPVRERLPFH